MKVNGALLRELHRIHIQRTDLRGRLERGPRQLNATQAACQQLQETLVTAKAELQRARINSDDKQLQLKSREARVTDLKNKLNGCSSNREYQALSEQIAADEQANSVLADEILEALEKIDELHAGVALLDGQSKQAKENADQVARRVADETSRLESELARVEAALADAESQLPADVRPEYRRVAEARGEEALAEVEGDFCGGCNQSVTPQMLNELSMALPVFCRTCGALLYTPEDRYVGQGNS